MRKKFTIEDEHRAGIRTYRLLDGDRIIARDVSKDFVDLLASAGVLLHACERARNLVEDEFNNPIIVTMDGSFGLLLDLQEAVAGAEAKPEVAGYV